MFQVDLLSLNVAIEAFDAHGLRGQNERMLDVADMVTILGSLYETVSVRFLILCWQCVWKIPRLVWCQLVLGVNIRRYLGAKLYG